MCIMLVCECDWTRTCLNRSSFPRRGTRGWWRVFWNRDKEPSDETLTFFASCSLSSKGNLASYVRRLTGYAHTHTRARQQTLLPPANQRASSVAWAPVFCSSSCNKMCAVQLTSGCSRKWRTRHKEVPRAEGAAGQWAKNAITLCATAVIPHGDLLPW